jgi:hypothetical protein
MTYKELLQKVNFKEIEPYLVKQYKVGDSLGWYKLHYDMLLMLEPKIHEDANGNVCKIEYYSDYDGDKHIEAWPMEGDLWEHSLTKEILVADDVTETLPELAACCLWHTSFYGFTPQTQDQCFDDMFCRPSAFKNYKEKFDFYAEIIAKHGGKVPTLKELSICKHQELSKEAKEYLSKSKANRSKRKKRFREEFMDLYYRRLSVIAEYIAKTISWLEDLSIDHLCQLFYSEKFCTEVIRSYTKNESGVEYLYRIIKDYKMIPNMEHLILLVTTGENGITPEEKSMLHHLASTVCGYKQYHVFFATDPSLGNQAIISYASYNM